VIYDSKPVTMQKDNASLVYKNAILMGSKPLSDITREKIVEINFSCSVTPPELQSVTFKIKDGCVKASGASTAL